MSKGPRESQRAGGGRAEHARVAAIDVGSNAVRLMVARVSRRGAFTVVRDERLPTQLGKGLADTGQLNASGIAASVAAIGRYQELARKSKAQAIRVVATAAVRDATNGRAFLDRVKRETGIAVDLISGDEEGALAFLSLARRFDVSELPAASVDIGGGSAQVILSTHGVAAKVVSMPLGAVRLTDQFGSWGAMATKGFPKLCGFIDEQLEQGLAGTPIKPRILVGTGGSVTSVALLAQAMRAEEGRGARGKRRKTDTAVDHRTLKAMIQAFRDSAPNLPEFAADAPPDRAPILFAGLVVLERLAEHLGVRVVHSHTGGLREGLCWSLADRVLTPAAGPLEAVRAFAAQCRYERGHSEHVAGLAVRLFEQLGDQRAVREAVRAEPRAAMLLEAAAVLHDVGTAVGYARHHKHSRDIILCADLQHLSRRDLLVLANIARYHRRVGPRTSHRAFAALTPADQRLVRVLSAVLRTADGLDRSHESLTARTQVEPRRGAVAVLAHPAGGGGISRELRASQGKSDLLAEVLGKKVRVRRAGRPQG